MKLQDFSSDTWETLQAPDTSSEGYPSSTLTLNNANPAILHLFRDRSGHYHLAIEAPKAQPKHLEDPGVNGLEIQLVEYQFHNGPTSRFIDLTCSISGYLEEFTEVVREIAHAILEEHTQPATAVETVIRNWLTFWGKASKDILSESDQVGLICELLVLQKLCEIDPEKALQSWRGPLGEKHDFSFPNWSLEIKGTRQSTRIHTINGIEQLVPPHSQKLGFVSFQLSKSNEPSALSLPDLIESINIDHLTNRPDLILRFKELLLGVGYSPVHATWYRDFRFDLIEGFFHVVDDNFPKLTLDMLKQALSTRITSIKYDVSLEGVLGESFETLEWGFCLA